MYGVGFPHLFTQGFEMTAKFGHVGARSQITSYTLEAELISGGATM